MRGEPLRAGDGGAGRFRRRGRWAIGGRSEAEAEPRGRLDWFRDRKLPEDETTRLRAGERWSGFVSLGGKQQVFFCLFVVLQLF